MRIVSSFTPFVTVLQALCHLGPSAATDPVLASIDPSVRAVVVVHSLDGWGCIPVHHLVLHRFLFPRLTLSLTYAACAQGRAFALLQPDGTLSLHDARNVERVGKAVVIPAAWIAFIHARGHCTDV